MGRLKKNEDKNNIVFVSDKLNSAKFAHFYVANNWHVVFTRWLNSAWWGVHMQVHVMHVMTQQVRADYALHGEK